MSKSPNPFGLPRPTSHGAASGPCGISPSGIELPHAVSGASRPPQAANSHSASDGRRHRPPNVSESHAQYATTSSHVTPTTGWRGEWKVGSFHQGGSGTRLAARHGAYCELVTGVRPSRNGPTTCPPSIPAGIGTTSGAHGEDFVSPERRTGATSFIGRSPSR